MISCPSGGDMSDGVPQFATAEYSGKPGTPSCKSCGQAISGAYYRVNAALTCATCAQRIVKGSGGIGGRRYQMAAVLLTYIAVSLAAVPTALSKSRRNGLLLDGAGGTGLRHQLGATAAFRQLMM